MIVLIPAYEPDGKLIDLLHRMRHRQVVVVDDGSGPAYADVFAVAERMGAIVVTLEGNRGKGFALRTGFSYIRQHFPGQDVVCADSDGQHRPIDIEAVAERVSAGDAAMVLGVRRFRGEVPARSRLGNSVTRVLFRLVTGQAIADTQTGLRGYPARMLPWLGEVGGDRFEYELRLLLRAARERLHIEQIEVATIYLEHNASSHFRPLRDSWRIYRPLLAFTASSLLAFSIDTVGLFLLTALTGNVAVSAIAARIASATVNFAVNRSWVFRSPGGGYSAPRYAALALAILGANVTLLQLLSTATGSLVVAKATTELLLFSVSFLVQKHLVFAHTKSNSGGKASTTVHAHTT